MENWVTFLLVNVVLVIVLGIITNLATPWIKSAYDRSVFSSRKKRMESLIAEYKMIKLYKLDSGIFTARLMLIVALMIVTTTGLLFVVGLALMSWLYLPPRNPTLYILIGVGISFIFFLLINALYSYLNNFFNNVSKFDKYKEKTINKIKKLGGNPEDLDKEELA